MFSLLTGRIICNGINRFFTIFLYFCSAVHKERRVNDCNKYNNTRHHSACTELRVQGKLEEHSRLRTHSLI